MSIPTFARYEIGIEGGTLPAELEREYEAVAGRNVRDDELPASGLGPGKYQVSVSIHVQTRGADGGAKILNNSAGWVEVQR